MEEGVLDEEMLDLNKIISLVKSNHVEEISKLLEPDLTEGNYFLLFLIY